MYEPLEPFDHGSGRIHEPLATPDHTMSRWATIINRPSGRPTVFVGATTMRLLDPTVLVDAPVAFRVVGVFVLTVLFGGTILTLSAGVVDRAADASMERPLLSVVYGVLAQGVLLILGSYAYSQLLRLGFVGPTVGVVGLWVGILGVLALSGLGLAVVGAAVTETASTRQLWPGLAIGAAIGAAAWFVPSFVLALLVWLLVVSFGIGGPMREWIHDSVEDDTR